MKKISILLFFVMIALCSCKKNGEKFDIDFTKMNHDAINGKMFEFLIAPEKYVNKSVIIGGQFHTEIHEGKRYYAVIFFDSDGDCPLSMDFIPPENLKFPEDFPNEKDEIKVSGKMRLFTVDGEEKLLFVSEKIE